MWKTVKLGDLCEVVTKGTTPTSVGHKFEDSGINFIKVESIALNGDFIASKFDFINEDCHESLKRSQLKDGDILFSIAGALGRTAVVRSDILPANTNQALAILRLRKDVEVSKKFLLYLLTSDSVKKQSEANKGGVAQQNLSLSQLKGYDLIIPPLAEQQRIVEKLDRAFEEIDRAIEATSNAQLSLASFQESKVKEYFVDNITGAQVVPLAQVAEYFNGLTYSPKDVSESGTIVLRSSNIQNGEMSYADIVRVDKEIKEKLIVRDSDILVCSRNGSKALIGKSALIGYAEEKMTFGTFMMIIRSSYNNYLQWFFKSSLFRSQIVQGENTMINQITRYMLDKVTLPFPPEDIQSEIALELSDIDAQVRALTEIYSRKKNSLNALKSAILAQELKGPES